MMEDKALNQHPAAPPSMQNQTSTVPDSMLPKGQTTNESRLKQLEDHLHNIASHIAADTGRTIHEIKNKFHKGAKEKEDDTAKK